MILRPRATGLATLIGGVLLAAGLLSYYCYRIAYFPGYDYDEVSFLNIAFRFVNFFDLNYPVFLDQDGFNAEPTRKYPPILAALLRSIYHFIVGFSAQASRVFSAILVAGTAVLAALLLTRVSGSRILSIAAAAAIALHPSVVASARSVRLEQEIAFLGMAAVALPLLAAGSAPALSWIGAGLLAGWAGTSHPWGAVFAVALGVSVLLHRKAWGAHDGLGFWRRILLLAAGMAVPLAVTGYTVFHDWPQYRDYTAAMAKLYAVRDGQNIEFFSSRFGNSIAFSLLPTSIAAKVHELELYAFMSFGTDYGYAAVFRRLQWLCVGIVVVSAPFALATVRSSADLVNATLHLVALSVLLMHFAYPVGTNYAIYPAIFVPLGAMSACLWAWRRLGPSPSSAAARGRHGAVAISLGVFLVAAGHYTIYHIRFLADSRRLEAVPLQAYYDALSGLGRELGLKDADYTFCDLATWAACGRKMRSAVQAVILAPAGLPKRIDAAVLQQPFWGSQVAKYPSLTTPMLSAAEKAARQDGLLRQLRLSGLARGPLGTTLFYTARAGKDDQLAFVDIAAGGRLSSYDGRPVAGSECAWRNLSAGLYVLVADRAIGSLPRIVVEGGAPDLDPRWSEGAFLERVAFLTVAGPAGSVEACSGAAGRLTLYGLTVR